MNACGFDGDGGEFSAGAAAEVSASFDGVVLRKVACADDVLEGVVGQVAWIVVGAAFGGDDVVGVYVVAQIKGGLRHGIGGSVGYKIVGEIGEYLEILWLKTWLKEIFMTW